MYINSSTKYLLVNNTTNQDMYSEFLKSVNVVTDFKTDDLTYLEKAIDFTEFITGSKIHNLDWCSDGEITLLKLFMYIFNNIHKEETLIVSLYNVYIHKISFYALIFGLTLLETNLKFIFYFDDFEEFENISILRGYSLDKFKDLKISQYIKIEIVEDKIFYNWFENYETD